MSDEEALEKARQEREEFRAETAKLAERVLELRADLRVKEAELRMAHSELQKVKGKHEDEQAVCDGLRKENARLKAQLPPVR